jgi:hypothetical protein
VDASSAWVLQSTEVADRIKRDRRAVSIEDITEDDLKLIEASVMEAGHEELDMELKDWLP